MINRIKNLNATAVLSKIFFQRARFASLVAKLVKYFRLLSKVATLHYSPLIIKHSLNLHI